MFCYHEHQSKMRAGAVKQDGCKVVNMSEGKNYPAYLSFFYIHIDSIVNCKKWLDENAKQSAAASFLGQLITKYGDISITVFKGGEVTGKSFVPIETNRRELNWGTSMYGPTGPVDRGNGLISWPADAVDCPELAAHTELRPLAAYTHYANSGESESGCSWMEVGNGQPIGGLEIYLHALIHWFLNRNETKTKGIITGSTLIYSPYTMDLSAKWPPSDSPFLQPETVIAFGLNNAAAKFRYNNICGLMFNFVKANNYNITKNAILRSDIWNNALSRSVMNVDLLQSYIRDRDC